MKFMIEYKIRTAGLNHDQNLANQEALLNAMLYMSAGSAEPPPVLRTGWEAIWQRRWADRRRAAGHPQRRSSAVIGADGGRARCDLASCRRGGCPPPGRPGGHNANPASRSDCSPGRSEERRVG